MRWLIAIAVVSCPTWAQFKSTVPLVAAPTTIVDAKGHYVDGLTIDDLILYDNNVPQKIQMDEMLFPISLVGATTSGTVLLNCAQPGQASTTIARARRIVEALAAYGPPGDLAS